MNDSQCTEKIEKIEGTSVTVSIPCNTEPFGVTFLLPGSNIAINEYDSHRDILISKSQIVLSFYINVFWPLTNNHRSKAEQVKAIFDTFHKTNYPNLPRKYSIVGHSVGGKIALLVPTLYDRDRVQTVIALDPVDQNPPEFTNSGSNDNLSLHDLFIPIIMTLTDGGGGISKEHDAHAIHRNNPTNSTLIRHEGAGHMAYTDNGGGYVGKMVPKGTPSGDYAAWEGAHELIREYIGSRDADVIELHVKTDSANIKRSKKVFRSSLYQFVLIMNAFVFIAFLVFWYKAEMILLLLSLNDIGPL